MKRRTTLPEVPHFNRYVEPTVDLVLSLLAEAYEDEDKLDRVLAQLSEEVLREVVKELKKLEKNGKIKLDQKFNLHNNPAVYTALKHIEQKELAKLTEYYWIGYQVITESLTRSYQNTLEKTYAMFNYQQATRESAPKSFNVMVQARDTYFVDHFLKVPWCQDGKLYSDRLYGHVANFQSKLAFVLEEGINKGKGLEWMMEAWRKLTHSTAYDTARLLKTETMAMWSRATKEAYLEMGITYVMIVGDAECGGICLDFVDGEPIPLEEAELGAELPPYHPNCACSFVAYEELVPIDEE